MTINRLKKRYYGLAFSIAILISTSIVFLDHVFNLFVYIPYSFNEELISKLDLKESEKNIYKVNINKLQEKNEVYLNYNINYSKFEEELKSLFIIYSEKIKIFEVILIEVKKDEKFYNVAHVKVQAKSKNEYITQNFANEATMMLIKENFKNNVENLKLNNNEITFKYIQTTPNTNTTQNKIEKKK